MPREVENPLASNRVELLGQVQNMWQRKSVQERQCKYYLTTISCPVPFCTDHSTADEHI